jgi:radical SAM protein with 4Fe4S-binding SPASM domain
MDTKKILTNKSFCPLPWTGFIVQQNGDIKNCVLAKDVIGNINKHSIQEILSGESNNEIKKQMLSDHKPSSCAGCYKLEEGKNNFDIISQRIYYIKELRAVDPTLYDQIENFDLHTVDIRWTNQCNQACVYCGPHNSTLWEKELGPTKLMSMEAKKAVRSFIFERVSQLKNVYLAGGEPTLMNENLEFLNLLLEKNPNVHLRVNTNLSNVDTKVAKLIKKFRNVHWIVSVEATGDHYNYIRYGGDWDKFCKNLNDIRCIDGHKISFNMLYCILNYLEIFKCIDFLTRAKFHNNSFVLGPVYTPVFLNILNLPVDKIEQIKTELRRRIDARPGFILEDGYVNLLKYLDTPFVKDLDQSFAELKLLDQKRQLDSRAIFKELYDTSR